MRAPGHAGASFSFKNLLMLPHIKHGQKKDLKQVPHPPAASKAIASTETGISNAYPSEGPAIVFVYYNIKCHINTYKDIYIHKYPYTYIYIYIYGLEDIHSNT